MLSTILKRKWVFLMGVAVIAALVITGGVFSAHRSRPALQKPLVKKVTELPPVISKVPKLRVTNVTVKNSGTPEASAVVEILNTSHLAVMSVEMSTKKKGDSGGVTIDGLTDPDNLKVVIPPFGTITLEMSFTEMIPGAPLAINAAEFSDGSSEGDKVALREMQAVRKHRRDLRQAEEKKPKQGMRQ